jgi:hypothetical protein
MDCLDMPELFSCMKNMKENRDSMYCKTEQASPDKKDITNMFTANSSRNDFSAGQRTKDEDWNSIFKIYDKYIELLEKK